MASLTLFVHLGHRDRAPFWFLEGWDQWTEFGSPLIYRYWWQHTVAFVLLAPVPMAVMRVFAGWRLRDLGIRLRGSGRECMLALGLWAAFVPVVRLVSGLPDFQHTYPQVPAAADSAPLFWAHHGYYFFYWFAWEFFFEGYCYSDLRVTSEVRLSCFLPFRSWSCTTPNLPWRCCL